MDVIDVFNNVHEPINANIIEIIQSIMIFLLDRKSFTTEGENFEDPSSQAAFYHVFSDQVLSATLPKLSETLLFIRDLVPFEYV